MGESDMPAILCSSPSRCRWHRSQAAGSNASVSGETSPRHCDTTTTGWSASFYYRFLRARDTARIVALGRLAALKGAQRASDSTVLLTFLSALSQTF